MINNEYIYIYMYVSASSTEKLFTKKTFEIYYSMYIEGCVIVQMFFTNY